MLFTCTSIITRSSSSIKIPRNPSQWFPFGNFSHLIRQEDSRAADWSIGTCPCFTSSTSSSDYVFRNIHHSSFFVFRPSANPLSVVHLLKGATELRVFLLFRARTSLSSCTAQQRTTDMRHTDIMHTDCGHTTEARTVLLFCYVPKESSPLSPLFLYPS